MTETTESADWTTEAGAVSVEDTAGPVHVEGVSATGTDESEAEEMARSSAAEAETESETGPPEKGPETSETG